MRYCAARYCESCREYVWCVRWHSGEQGSRGPTRRSERPYIVEDLLGVGQLEDGMGVSVEQCLDCGIPSQIVTSVVDLRTRQPSWYLVCDRWEGADGETYEGCGRRLRLFQVKQYEADWVS